MQDKDLLRLVIATIKAGLIERGLSVFTNAGPNTPSSITVIQSNQPTQQGITTGPLVAVYQFPARRYGSMKREDVWVPADGPTAGYMSHREIQKMETSFQITTLYTQNPNQTTGLTSADLANIVADCLQSDNGLKQLRDAGLGIYRVTDIRTPAFLDDRDRNEYAPNFDFTLTHENARLTTSPHVDAFEASINRV